MMTQRVVKIYQSKQGVEPYAKWISALKDITTKARIEQRIRRIELNNFGDHQSVGAGVWELRLNFGPGYRIYYGIVDNIVVLLLCGGDKKTQQNDIDYAQKC